MIPKVTYWAPDNTWTVSWGDGPTQMLAGFKDEGVAYITAHAFGWGYKIATEDAAKIADEICLGWTETQHTGETIRARSRTQGETDR